MSRPRRRVLHTRTAREGDVAVARTMAAVSVMAVPRRGYASTYFRCPALAQLEIGKDKVSRHVPRMSMKGGDEEHADDEEMLKGDELREECEGEGEGKERGMGVHACCGGFRTTRARSAGWYPRSARWIFI